MCPLSMTPLSSVLLVDAAAVTLAQPENSPASHIIHMLRWVVATKASLSERGTTVQAGLSALKTPQSYSSTSNKEDPLSTEASTLSSSYCHLKSTLKVSFIRLCSTQLPK